jgi:transposase
MFVDRSGLESNEAEVRSAQTIQVLKDRLAIWQISWARKMKTSDTARQLKRTTAFAQLSEQGVAVVILNPRAVRQFAQSMGWLEKTDRIDGGIIAWYAEVKKSQPTCPAPQNQQNLRALVTRLRQLTEIRTVQLNQQRLITRPSGASFVQKAAGVAGPPNPRTRTANRGAG